MTDEISEGHGAIPEGQFHPAARHALAYVNSLSFEQKAMWLETFASSALAGNAEAEIYQETLRRVMDCDGVGDRYILGLAWFIRRSEDEV